MKPESLPGEQWKYINGYGESYRISNFGRVHSCDRFVLRRDGRENHVKGTLLKTRLSGGKHSTSAFTRLSLDCVVTSYYLTRLVWEHFISSDIPAKVGHTDKNPRNNWAGNLYRLSE